MVRAATTPITQATEGEREGEESEKQAIAHAN